MLRPTAECHIEKSVYWVCHFFILKRPSRMLTLASMIFVNMSANFERERFRERERERERERK